MKKIKIQDIDWHKDLLIHNALNRRPEKIHEFNTQKFNRRMRALHLTGYILPNRKYEHLTKGHY